MPKDFIGWCYLRSAVERWGKTPLSRKRSHSTLVIILVLVYAQLLSRLGQGTSKIPTACWRIHLKNSPATCGRIGWSDSSADNQNQQPTIQHPSIHQSSLRLPHLSADSSAITLVAAEASSAKGDRRWPAAPSRRVVASAKTEAQRRWKELPPYKLITFNQRQKILPGDGCFATVGSV